MTLSSMGLTHLPLCTGAGVNRHPAKTFWSARYKDESTKCCSYGAGRTAVAALAKCIRHVLKMHIKANPAAEPLWQEQIKALATVIQQQ